ncbi:hypothetical protein KBB05_05660 [Patescibacteria group bacterium]|nr:hypothetical protein [Patescibacteria group bacterium]
MVKVSGSVHDQILTSALSIIRSKSSYASISVATALPDLTVRAKFAFQAAYGLSTKETT